MKIKGLLLLLLLSITIVLPGQLHEWRGTDRNGVYDGAGVLSFWPADGPEQVLEITGLGNGYGSPVFTEDGFYITGEADTTAWLFHFNNEGELVWKSSFGREWVRSFPGSRSAPTIIDDLLYVTSGMGNLYCFNAKTGSVVWSVDQMRDLNGLHSLHGHSESPVIHNDKVFLNPGGRDTNFVALNRFSGKIIWVSKGNGEAHGYNSPRLIKAASHNILVTFTAYALIGIDAENGDVLWTHDQTNTPVEKRKPGLGDTHSNTVLSDGRYIYYVAGDGNGAVKLEITDGGKGIREVWTNPTFDGYMGGLILKGDNLYSCTTAKRDLRSVNIHTGEYTDSLKAGPGALIAAGDMLYYYNQKGEVSLISIASGKMEAVSSFKVTKGEKEHFAHPAVHNGILYVRHGDYLLGYAIKEN